ncbi:MAG: SDR family NAD(P)-dependent oxidoreductase [Bacteroidota bacterium]|nr:SDR family NAD(P)-dependent oxidoreductase [Bacteroidota bacterium]
MTDLTNKVVVVTGSANGLGKALATELFKQGCNLALLDININGLEKLKAVLQRGHQKITTHKVDISQEQQIISARAEILEQHQRIDILINNAGVSISQTFDQLELADYKWLFDINFWGTVYCTKHFLPDLKQQTDSRLVNIISDFALMGFPGKTTYGSSKSAVMGFTNSLRTELAETTVKVSLVIPPPLNTGLVINSKHIDDIKRKNEARFLEKNSMSLDKAARKIISKVKAGKFRIVIGSMMFWIDFASRLFPTALHRLIGNNKKRFDFV